MKARFRYFWRADAVEAPEKQSAAEPAAQPNFVARPNRGEIDFDALRASVMARLTKARAYLAK